MDGGVSIGSTLEMDHADARVRSDPRFSRAAYVGHKGWVSMELSGAVDWAEVEALVRESYRLIAPKRLSAQLGDAPAKPAAKKTAAKKTAAKKTAAKKTAAKKTATAKARAAR